MKALYARKTHTEETIGPGQYNIAEKFGNEAPKYKIGHRYQGKDDIQSVGYYDAPKQNKGPSYTIARRYSKKEEDNSVGPNFIPTPSSGRFGPYIHTKPAQSRSFDDVMAGPGEYMTSPRFGSNSPRYSIKGRRLDEFKSEVSPGPADYLPVLSPSSPRYSIGVKTASHSGDALPGPSDYVQSEPKSARQGICFHIRPKNQDVEVTPGPAAYVPPTYFGKEAPACKIGNRPSIASQRSSGEYVNLGTAIGKGPRYTIGKKPPKNRDVQLSPGFYEGPYAFGSESQKTAIRPRLRNLSVPPSLGPGPAAFATGKPLGTDAPKYSFSGRDGPDWTKVEPAPGPSDYVAPPPLHPKGYTISPRTKNMMQPERLGVGFYNPGPLPKGPMYTIGSKEKCDLVKI